MKNMCIYSIMFSLLLKNMYFVFFCCRKLYCRDFKCNLYIGNL